MTNIPDRAYVASSTEYQLDGKPEALSQLHLGKFPLTVSLELSPTEFDELKQRLESGKDSSLSYLSPGQVQQVVTIINSTNFKPVRFGVKLNHEYERNYVIVAEMKPQELPE